MHNRDAQSLELIAQINRDLRSLAMDWADLARLSEQVAQGAADNRKRQLDAARQLIG